MNKKRNNRTTNEINICDNVAFRTIINISMLLGEKKGLRPIHYLMAINPDIIDFKDKKNKLEFINLITPPKIKDENILYKHSKNELSYLKNITKWIKPIILNDNDRIVKGCIHSKSHLNYCLDKLVNKFHVLDRIKDNEFVYYKINEKGNNCFTRWYVNNIIKKCPDKYLRNIQNKITRELANKIKNKNIIHSIFSLSEVH